MARDSLVMSLTQSHERRGEFRLFNPTIGAGASPTGEMLLNVSRSGLAVGVKNCRFARGEHYQVTLEHGTNRADLEGRVCWTRSTWSRESAEPGAGGYFQAAGLEITAPLTDEQQERWRSLREQVQDGSAMLDVRIGPLT